MTVEELTKLIVEWVAEHGRYESAWLTPDPQFEINGTLLLDYMSNITNIPKETIGEWVDNYNEKRNRELAYE